MAAKKNEVYPLRIEGYGSAGEGVARLDGQAVFVKGAERGCGWYQSIGKHKP